MTQANLPKSLITVYCTWVVETAVIAQPVRRKNSSFVRMEEVVIVRLHLQIHQQQHRVCLQHRVFTAIRGNVGFVALLLQTGEKSQCVLTVHHAHVSSVCSLFCSLFRKLFITADMRNNVHVNIDGLMMFKLIRSATQVAPLIL